ncbi:unnamed protein product [Trifolium pratense]|uniref:Uncharacterized protein n=1 Tax=Trifolium pratense TaxID=57577 RepID=A0ACB0JM52_TRIPR|nr:unnamed protein product [Trifolium pratense]
MYGLLWNPWQPEVQILSLGFWIVSEFTLYMYQECNKLIVHDFIDIGNIVTLKGVEVKPNRTVTSFCAQLLANAQAAAVNANNKKQACANEDWILSFTILSTLGTWFGELCYSSFFIHSFS